MKISRSRLREIIRQSIQEEKDYEEFFRTELEKTGYSSPAEMSDDEKSEFFSNIDKGWKAKNEGNAFGAAVVKAKEAGEDEFEVGGKTFKVESITKKSSYETGDLVRIISKPKYVVDRNFWGKSGYVKSKMGRDLAVHFPNGRTILVSPVDLEKVHSESVNEVFKHIIHVDTPTQVVSKPIAAQIMALAKKGVRSKEIGLEMGFTGNAKLAADTFQKVKNRIYFELDKKESTINKTESVESVNEVKLYESIGFIPMDLEEDLRITAKWGGVSIKGVIGFLNAMIDSGLTDSDLVINPPKNTHFQREKAREKKIQDIWKKIKPKYKGDFHRGNMYYATISRLIIFQRLNILKRFKPYRKYQTESVESVIENASRTSAEMVQDANRIKKELTDLKREYSKSKTETNKTRVAAKEEQLRRVANAIRNARADEADAKTEGNAFGAAVVKAKKAGKDEFEVDGKTYPVKESSINESNYDLMFGRLGSGIAVSNKKVTDPNTKDYKFVAHISDSGKIDWKDKEAQKNPTVRREVEKRAKSMNESINENKKYNTLDDFEKYAKVGDVFYLGKDDQFKRASKNDYYKVVDKKSDNSLIITKGNSRKKYTIGADRYDEPVIVIKESVNGITESISDATKFYNSLKPGQSVKYTGPEKNGFKKGETYKVDHVKSSSTFQKTVVITDGSKKLIVKGHGSVRPVNESDDCGCGSSKINEGNAFGMAVTKAKQEGKKEFEFNGKIYKVKKGSYEKNEVAKESVNESVSVFDERHFGKKGIIIMIDDGGKKVSAIFKDKKNADKYNRNNPSDVKKLLDLAKKTPYPKAIDESVNEDVNFRDGKYRFYSKNSVGYLTYNGKLLSKGDYDFEGGDSYWMSHSSWKGQKAFDTGKDVIKYFKSKKITTESVNEGKHDVMLDKLADIVKDAKSFMDVGKVLKSNGIKYSFSTSMIPMYKIDKHPIAIVNKKYAAGAEREIGDIAIGLLESIRTK